MPAGGFKPLIDADKWSPALVVLRLARERRRCSDQRCSFRDNYQSHAATLAAASSFRERLTPTV